MNAHVSETSQQESWPQFLDQTCADGFLPPDSLRWAMEQVMLGEASPAQIAAFLVSLRVRGVTGADLATLVDVMVEHAVAVNVDGVTVDTCGTGGDNMGSANISTMAAVVVAACGERVVKHGNRASSSQAGSADVLESLGVAIDLAPENIAECVDRASIAFCFAPIFHPAMKYAGPIRRELGIRTVFNVLGPLANPARPAAQVVGVADLAMAPVVAAALATRGTSALVVRGEDGMDEITPAGFTRVWDCRGGEVIESLFDVADLGIQRAPLSALAGGDATRNAEIAAAVLRPNPPTELLAIRDAVAVNAAAALAAVAHAKAPTTHRSDLTNELPGQLARAQIAMETGAVADTLATWISVSKQLR